MTPDELTAIEERLNAASEKCPRMESREVGGPCRRVAVLDETAFCEVLLDGRHLIDALRAERAENATLRAALNVSEGTPQDVIAAAVAMNDGSEKALRIVRHVIAQGYRIDAERAENERLRIFTNAVVSGLRWTGDGYDWNPTDGDYRESPPEAIRRAATSVETKIAALESDLARLRAERDEAKEQLRKLGHGNPFI